MNSLSGDKLLANTLRRPLLTLLVSLLLLFASAIFFFPPRSFRGLNRRSSRLYRYTSLRKWSPSIWLLERDWRRSRVPYPSAVTLSGDSSLSGKFQSLPVELRLLIFKYAVGDRVVHVLGDDRLLIGRQCSSDNVEAWYHPCWKMEKSIPSLNHLLTVNRHIYTEAAEVLYSSNTYHFLRPSCFLAFVQTIPPCALSNFRSLKLYFNPTTAGEDVAYVAMWEILKSLPRLQEIRLLIAPSVMTLDVWKKHERPLLDPIKHFNRAMVTFDVFLSVFPDWISDDYLDSCHIRPIKEMQQLSGAHLSRYAIRTPLGNIL